MTSNETSRAHSPRIGEPRAGRSQELRRAGEPQAASIGNGRKHCLAVLLLRVSGDAMIEPVVRIYFDHNATTPLHPAVLEAMTQALADDFGNASSVHAF